MNVPRLRALSAALLLSAAFALSGCGGDKQPAEAQPVVPVQAATVEAGPISQILTGDAILAPRAQAAIAPRITAPVRRFYVQRGQRVHKGELLATLENSDLRAAALDSQGVYDQAQASYSTAVGASLPEQFQTAKLDLANADANLKLAQQVYDARKTLFAQGAIPGRDLDTARASLVQAQSAYDLAKKRFDALQSFAQKDALKSAKAQLVSAQGKYQGAEAQLSYSEIRSPIDGVVTDRPLYAGETAAAGAPLVTIMDTKTLIAKTHLPQHDAAQLRVGQSAQLEVPGLAQPVEGKVSVVSPALDPGSTTIEIWVAVPNADGRLKAGAPVHVNITGRTLPHATLIPAEALVTSPDGAKSVMVIGPDSVAHTRAVQTGITDDGKIQIVSGLKPGERIVTAGAYAMTDGTKVKVLAPGENPEADDKPAPGKEGAKD
jgi:HlyD family secretion protein